MTASVVGVDFSTYEASLVGLPLDGAIGAVRRVRVKFRPASRSGDDEMIAALAAVASAIRDGILNLGVGTFYQPRDEAVAWIERGYGASRRSDWSLGAYFGAIHAACSSFGLAGVNPVGAGEWKKIVTEAAGVGLVKDGTRGNPNAKKEVANEACRALLSLGEVDATDWSPDDLDAFGVSYAGRVLNRAAVAA